MNTTNHGILEGKVFHVISLRYYFKCRNLTQLRENLPISLKNQVTVSKVPQYSVTSKEWFFLNEKIKNLLNVEVAVEHYLLKGDLMINYNNNP